MVELIRLVKADSEKGRQIVAALSNRQLELPEDLVKTVEEILTDVRQHGDNALVKYTRKFDCKNFTSDMIRISDDEIERACSTIDNKIALSLKKAKENIEDFHKKQMPRSWFDTRSNQTIVGQMIRPVESAGLYVPGGKSGQTPLVSSVLMNAIPAAIAGVERIILCTPPGTDGQVSPYLLAAAKLAGVHEVYRAGSAWAIGAMAYGTETIKPVDVIAGPGNIFVTIAKKLLSGFVGIDMVAGPSEILVIADQWARADFIAADLLSQAEHDPMATSILITNSEDVANKVVEELSKQLKSLERNEIAEKSLKDNGVVLMVESLEKACELANDIGPEHLELMVKDPWQLLPLIKNAGAVFLGDYTPEPVGDYIAGPNHVLPTMGTSRFSSALGVDTFLKRTSIVSYSKKAFLQDVKDIMALAEIEGLTAHRNSAKIRLE